MENFPNLCVSMPQNQLFAQTPRDEVFLLGSRSSVVDAKLDYTLYLWATP
jgi:hypothetical protein